MRIHADPDLKHWYFLQDDASNLFHIPREIAALDAASVFPHTSLDVKYVNTVNITITTGAGYCQVPEGFHNCMW